MGWGLFHERSIVPTSHPPLRPLMDTFCSNHFFNVYKRILCLHLMRQQKRMRGSRGDLESRLPHVVYMDIAASANRLVTDLHYLELISQNVWSVYRRSKSTRTGGQSKGSNTFSFLAERILEKEGERRTYSSKTPHSYPYPKQRKQEAEKKPASVVNLEASREDACAEEDSTISINTFIRCAPTI